MIKGLKNKQELQLKTLLRSLDLFLFGDFFVYLIKQNKQKKVPLHNTELTKNILILIKNGKRLKATLDSLRKQNYSYFNFSIYHESYDLTKCDEEYVLFLEAGDELKSDALSRLIDATQFGEIVYSDHDLKKWRIPVHPKYKPDFNLDYYRSYPYIDHAVLIKRDLIQQSKVTYPNQVIYQTILSNYHQINFVHLPQVLFHLKQEIELNKDFKSILEQHYQKEKIDVQVKRDAHFYRSQYCDQEEKVSIIILNKDHKEDLQKCVESIFRYTRKSSFEIIVLDNNSDTKEIKSYYDEINLFDNVQIIEYEGGYHYSKMANFASKFAHYDYLLFLDNDIEILFYGWLEQIIGECKREDMGCVGMKLLYPNKTIQYCGTILTYPSIIYPFVGMDENYQGYMSRASIKQNCSAISGSALLTKKDLFNQLNGFNENYQMFFSDIDYCLRVQEAGYLILFDPDVTLIHQESKTLNSEQNRLAIKQAYQQDLDLLYITYKYFFQQGDPYYNKNLTENRKDYSIK